ncbi:alpha/beta hydrolase family esterase [Rhodoferax sp.]|uniref:extracellular catalytic domain type 1 short-chain-length polyhydroxyalkanoate depolymerase n=1 Tax=Rhodoferax sp. TaxID=50421 RepID=UPI00374CFD38
MRRSLSSLFFKSLKRIGKVQQRQQKQLVKGLSAAAKKVLKSAAKSASKSAAPAAKKSISKPSAKPKAVPPASAVLPGSWTRAVYAAPSGQRMTYWLYLPLRDPVQALRPMPLVVMLHGCTQTAPEFAQGTRMNALAQRKGFAVLYPQQLLTIDSHRCWQWYQRTTQHGGGEAALVADLLTQVVARHALDASRVYLAGMSAGAALAQTIALRYPYRIAAVGMHSGPVFGTADNRLGAFAAMQTGGGAALALAVQPMVNAPDFPRMPAMLLHGDADKVVRVVNLLQAAQQWCLVNHIDASSQPPVLLEVPARPGGRSPRHGYQRMDYRQGRKPLVSVCRIAGLEHAWSGGDDSLRFNSKLGPDASALLWAFFAKHQRARLAPR